VSSLRRSVIFRSFFWLVKLISLFLHLELKINEIKIFDLINIMDTLELFFWIIFVLLIIIIIAIILLTFVKQATFFQPTHDEKWYPDIKKCEGLQLDTLSGNRDVDKAVEYCKKYVTNFENRYLIISDKSCRAYTRQELDDIKYKRITNLSELQYINIWKFENFKGNRIVLYFHGNNDNVSYRKYVVDICNLLKLNLLLVDYRGYGESSGQPDNVSLLRDAKTAYKYVTQHYHWNDVIIWGESLGGIAAIWTAHKYKANALVLLSTFSDIGTIIKKLGLNPGANKMLKKFANSKLMNNGKWIHEVKIPTIIMHSEEDDILPYVNAQMNYKAVSAEKKKLITIQGPHAHPFFTDKQLIELLEFIEIKDPEVMNHQNVGKVLEVINNL
jgi:esterase/lipase